MSESHYEKKRYIVLKDEVLDKATTTARSRYQRNVPTDRATFMKSEPSRFAAADVQRQDGSSMSVVAQGTVGSQGYRVQGLGTVVPLGESTSADVAGSGKVVHPGGADEARVSLVKQSNLASQFRSPSCHYDKMSYGLEVNDENDEIYARSDVLSLKNGNILCVFTESKKPPATWTFRDFLTVFESGGPGDVVRIRMFDKVSGAWVKKKSLSISIDEKSVSDFQSAQAAFGTSLEHVNVTGISLAQDSSGDVYVFATLFLGAVRQQISTYHPGFLYVAKLAGDNRYADSLETSFGTVSTDIVSITPLNSISEVEPVKGLSARAKPLDVSAEILPDGRFVCCVFLEDSVYSLVSGDSGRTFAANKIKQFGEVVSATLGHVSIAQRHASLDTCLTKDGTVVLAIACPNACTEDGYKDHEVDHAAKSTLSLFSSSNGYSWGSEKNLCDSDPDRYEEPYDHPNFPNVAKATAGHDRSICALDVSVCLNQDSNILVTAVSYNLNGVGGAHYQGLFQVVLNHRSFAGLSTTDDICNDPSYEITNADGSLGCLVNRLQRSYPSFPRRSTWLLADYGGVYTDYQDHALGMSTNLFFETQYLGHLFLGGVPAYWRDGTFPSNLSTHGSAGGDSLYGGGPLRFHGPISVSTCSWNGSVVTVLGEFSTERTYGYPAYEKVAIDKGSSLSTFDGSNLAHNSCLKVLFSNGLNPAQVRLPTTLMYENQCMDILGEPPTYQASNGGVNNSSVESDAKFYYFGSNSWQLSYDVGLPPTHSDQFTKVETAAADRVNTLIEPGRIVELSDLTEDYDLGHVLELTGGVSSAPDGRVGQVIGSISLISQGSFTFRSGGDFRNFLNAGDFVLLGTQLNRIVDAVYGGSGQDAVYTLQVETNASAASATSYIKTDPRLPYFINGTGSANVPRNVYTTLTVAELSALNPGDYFSLGSKNYVQVPNAAEIEFAFESDISGQLLSTNGFNSTTNQLFTSTDVSNARAHSIITVGASNIKFRVLSTTTSGSNFVINVDPYYDDFTNISDGDSFVIKPRYENILPGDRFYKLSDSSKSGIVTGKKTFMGIVDHTTIYVVFDSINVTRNDISGTTVVFETYPEHPTDGALNMRDWTVNNHTVRSHSEWYDKSPGRSGTDFTSAAGSPLVDYVDIWLPDSGIALMQSQDIRVVPDVDEVFFDAGIRMDNYRNDVMKTVDTAGTIYNKRFTSSSEKEFTRANTGNLSFVVRAVITVDQGGGYVYTGQEATSGFSGLAHSSLMVHNYDSVHNKGIRLHLGFGRDETDSTKVAFQVWDAYGLSELCKIQITDDGLEFNSLYVNSPIYEVVMSLHWTDGRAPTTSAEFNSEKHRVTLMVREFDFHSDPMLMNDYHVAYSTAPGDLTGNNVSFVPSSITPKLGFGIFDSGRSNQSSEVWTHDMTTFRIWSFRYANSFLATSQASVFCAVSGDEFRSIDQVSNFRTLRNFLEMDPTSYRLGFSDYKNYDGGVLSPMQLPLASSVPFQVDQDISLAFLGSAESGDTFTYHDDSLFRAENVFSLPVYSGWRSDDRRIPFARANPKPTLDITPSQDLIYDFGEEGFLPESLCLFGVNTDGIMIDFYDDENTGMGYFALPDGHGEEDVVVDLVGTSYPPLSIWMGSPGGPQARLYELMAQDQDHFLGNTNNGSNRWVFGLRKLFGRISFRPNHMWHWTNRFGNIPDDDDGENDANEHTWHPLAAIGDPREQSSPENNRYIHFFEHPNVAGVNGAAYNQLFELDDGLGKSWWRPAVQQKSAQFIPGRFKSSEGENYYLVVNFELPSTHAFNANWGDSYDTIHLALVKGTESAYRAIFKIEDNGVNWLKLCSSIGMFTCDRTNFSRLCIDNMSIISDRVGTNLPDYFPLVNPEDPYYGTADNLPLGDPDGTSKAGLPVDRNHRYRFMRIRLSGGYIADPSERFLRVGSVVGGRRVELANPDIEWGYSQDIDFGNSLTGGLTGQRRSRRLHKPRRSWSVSYSPKPSPTILAPRVNLPGDTVSDRTKRYFQKEVRGYGSTGSKDYLNSEQITNYNKLSWIEAVQRIMNVGVNGDVFALCFDGDGMINFRDLSFVTEHDASTYWIYRPATTRPALCDPHNFCVARVSEYGGADHTGYLYQKGTRPDSTGKAYTFGPFGLRNMGVDAQTMFESDQKYLKYSTVDGNTLGPIMKIKKIVFSEEL